MGVNAHLVDGIGPIISTRGDDLLAHGGTCLGVRFEGRRGRETRRLSKSVSPNVAARCFFLTL